jgi:hypothetical protein
MRPAPPEYRWRIAADKLTKRPGKSSTPGQSWMIVRVLLTARGGEEVVGAPGRDLLVSDRHTFADLATAIDRAFARWDLSHLHEFRFDDGRRIGMIDLEEPDDDVADLDETKVTVQQARLLRGDTFEYVFDFGDSWEHRCTVLRCKVDPLKESGAASLEIVPVFGWGTIPDQHGRTIRGDGSELPEDRE